MKIKKVKTNKQTKKLWVYVRFTIERNAFIFKVKEALLVAFGISELRELKNFGPSKQIENVFILVLQWDK